MFAFARMTGEFRLLLCCIDPLIVVIGVLGFIFLAQECLFPRLGRASMSPSQLSEFLSLYRAIPSAISAPHTAG